MSDVKTLYDQISEIYGRGLPKKVVSDITKLIPKTLEPDEDVYDRYVYLNQLYTYGEYKSCISLYDKRYSSPIHEYGEKEELIYTFRKIEPGLIKDHRVRNDKGRFVHTKETIEAKKLDQDVSNVFLIKRTIWDTMKYEKKMVLYTIYVYNHSTRAEIQRKEQAKTALDQLKITLTTNEKGNGDNGNNKNR